MDCLDDFYQLDGLEVFNTGDSFDMPIQLYDTATSAAFEIPENATFAAQLNDQYGNMIATLSAIRVPDQLGYINVSFSESTVNWPAGIARTDIKMRIGAVTHTSYPITFKIRRSQTP